MPWRHLAANENRFKEDNGGGCIQNYDNLTNEGYNLKYTAH